jgi:hypothetical protein
MACNNFATHRIHLGLKFQVQYAIAKVVQSSATVAPHLAGSFGYDLRMINSPEPGNRLVCFAM